MTPAEYGIIPSYRISAMQRYIGEGRRPGDFLRAVLENNLHEAVVLADEQNMRCLPAYVKYLAANAPTMCWGSIAKVAAWIDMHEAKRSAT